MMESRERVGRRIAALRKVRGWTQAELASLTDNSVCWDQPTIARVEKGKRRVAVEELLAIAAALNVSPLYILTPEEPEESVQIGASEFPAHQVRDWMRGFAPLPGSDPGDFAKVIPFDDRVFVTDSNLRAYIDVTQGAARARAEGDAASYNELANDRLGLLGVMQDMDEGVFDGA